ncbi:MAG: hypothetical protein DID92_2727745127 [Candidatus Nitrotoga sp. SPKER]|nr:MAG: hypothetical protein DID92_2727745127 [Candidatus Nitrotoga sp. SPKER]
MAKSRYKNAKDKRDGGAFFTVPAAVLNGAAYLGCGSHARMLLFDLLAQYRGNNNGDLCAAFSLMKRRGWKSTHTLIAAKRELLDAGLIMETRMGARPNKASLYALTWHALDECGGKLDISAQGFQRGAYKLKDPLPPMVKIATLNAVAASRTE